MSWTSAISGRLIVRTGERMGVLPDDRPGTVETFVIAWKWGQYLGDDALHRGVDVCVSSWRRAAPDTFPTMAKAGGNYLNWQLSLIEARRNGYVEGIMLDAAGFVSEGSGENIFIVREGVVYTPPISAGILGGITRDSVIRWATWATRCGSRSAARVSLHGRRAVLQRHGRRDHAGPIGRPHSGRRGQPGSRHPGGAGPVSGDRSGPGPRPVRVADAGARAGGRREMTDGRPRCV